MPQIRIGDGRPSPLDVGLVVGFGSKNLENYDPTRDAPSFIKGSQVTPASPGRRKDKKNKYFSKTIIGLYPSNRFGYGIGVIGIRPRRLDRIPQNERWCIAAA